MQGGGIGVLYLVIFYLVIFAAFRLYGLVPPAAAFALLVAVAALSAMIAGEGGSARRRNGPLGLGAGWVPHRLAFAARGAKPFELACGRHDAKPAAFPIATLVPGYKREEDLELRRGATPAGLAIGEAQAAATPQQLGGEGALRQRVDWKRWTLWASLVLGVVVLGWMAIRLGRLMGEIDLPR